MEFSDSMSKLSVDLFFFFFLDEKEIFKNGENHGIEKIEELNI